MKIRECYSCKRYVEESDTEKIEGKFHCYSCFGFCYECNKPYPLNEKDESKYCKQCQNIKK